MHAVAGNSCVFRCFLTTPYKIFYYLLCIIGYNGISNFIWKYNATRITFISHKVYSRDPKAYRAKYGCLDPNFANQALTNDII
ncbi:hypothetical protein TVAG_038660 [Trichomonas vaginalis G3]|uniref:Uncharacterized protein n=1 Tax=Trichomonas vaginalis (strain ATCC PRA-98 / G3) TaxID=412133 RepID=A2DY22_TRIV3|nr:hypothetical protein TVAGG3_0960540 [Trichomonas vaginalis G3]EAY14758.1 hypothetical protein TVAG_038660 [Trichomonas vaginalis G3]KAI5487871.1 hypothetical protein TVAGG3_0960540 [Trichomonas vaginalis G3]|eukprot:XP_001326981.1 hypothetical protein [Trichomonas vaginalis G3]